MSAYASYWGPVSVFFLVISKFKPKRQEQDDPLIVIDFAYCVAYIVGCGDTAFWLINQRALAWMEGVEIMDTKTESEFIVRGMLLHLVYLLTLRWEQRQMIYGAEQVLFLVFSVLAFLIGRGSVDTPFIRIIFTTLVFINTIRHILTFLGMVYQGLAPPSHSEKTTTAAATANLMDAVPSISAKPRYPTLKRCGDAIYSRLPSAAFVWLVFTYTILLVPAFYLPYTSKDVYYSWEYGVYIFFFSWIYPLIYHFSLPVQAVPLVMEVRFPLLTPSSTSASQNVQTPMIGDLLDFTPMEKKEEDLLS
jgi:hypothetical protein